GPRFPAPAAGRNGPAGAAPAGTKLVPHFGQRTAFPGAGGAASFRPAPHAGFGHVPLSAIAPPFAAPAGPLGGSLRARGQAAAPAGSAGHHRARRGRSKHKSTSANDPGREGSSPPGSPRPTPPAPLPHP